MIRELKEQVIFFLKNRIYIISLILAAVMGYGYQLSHGTCGVDDICIGLYFEKGLGVAIGRWPYYVLNKIIPLAEYVPFIWDFITILLLMAAATVWCGLIRMVLKRELSIWCYVIFAVFFLDYSMIAEVFVFYLQNGLGFLYLLTALGLFATYYLYSRKSIGKKESVIIKLLIIAAVAIAVGFYESAANVYLSGVLLVIYINLIGEKDSRFCIKDIVAVLFWVIRVLVYSIVIRRIVRTILMRVFEIQPYLFYRSASSISWIFEGDLLENLYQLMMGIFRDYFAVGVIYYPVRLFAAATIVFLVYVIVRSIRDKEILQAAVGIMVYVSLFALCVLQGKALGYRACQTFNIFVGIVFWGFVERILKSSKWVKILGITFVIICIYNSVYDMTKWFELDYRKTEYEMAVIDQIAIDLRSGGYNIDEKPIVVVGDFEIEDALYNEYCIKEGDFGWELVKWAAEESGMTIKERFAYGQNNPSILDWSVTSFSSYGGFNVAIMDFFLYRGHTFQWADLATCEKACDKYYTLDKELYDIDQTLEVYTEAYGEEESYPNAGYIEETDEYIVIKL